MQQISNNWRHGGVRKKYHRTWLSMSLFHVLGIILVKAFLTRTSIVNKDLWHRLRGLRPDESV
jgi:hypothetical protein